MPRFEVAAGTPRDVPVPDRADQAVTITAFNCAVHLFDAKEGVEIGRSGQGQIISNLELDPAVFFVRLEALGANACAFVHFHPVR